MKKDYLPSDLEVLSQIAKVNAPAFLYTRIKEKLRHNYTVNFTPKISVSLGFSLVLILILNAAVILKYQPRSLPQKNLLVSLNLQSTNDLYP